MDCEYRETEVLIIGAGAAGLRTAIELAQRGTEVLVVGKRAHGDAHTVQAAGGINAALGSRDEEDHWTLHAADTLREGHFVCQPDAVELLARLAPERILELARWGCPFERTDDGKLEQRYFGAHTYRRTCFVGDETGKAILETLVDRADELDVPHRQEVMLTEIIVHSGRAVGAVGWELSGRRPVVYSAKAVVIAAGGCTGLYRRHSSRAGENTGDAMGLAWRAGAEMRDMEFIQFHPTGMVTPEEMEGELVTEAVRAEGGRLYNTEGGRFMERYAPEEMELAPRDVVARAIACEIEEGRATQRGGVWLDISHRDEDYIAERLPQMYRRFERLGINISEESMEVAPTAHYAMGGTKVDFHTGATSVDGLYAVGEATAGVHGANRLGGNSLIETLVFGQLAGAHLASWVEDRDRAVLQDEDLRRRIDGWRGLSRQHGHHSPESLVDRLAAILGQCASIVRDDRGLGRGLEELERLRDDARDMRVHTTAGSSAFARVCNLEFMIDTTQMILWSAKRRRESRGAHRRSDFSETDRDWRKSIVCRRDDSGGVKMWTEEVGEPSGEVQAALERELHLDYHHLE